MNDDVVIQATHVSKKFCRSLKHVMFYGAKDISRNMVSLSSQPETLREGEFWAVNDISFELKRGGTLGLIGPNGSGKSTMLKMLNGIFMPDKGKIEIKGRVSALIEVGAGFHPMLTGRENVYINGTILGMSKKEIDKKFDQIVDFAELDDFIDAPVKHYSSGMYVRLGFAVAIHTEPDILIMDEILAVGDAAFQNKCFTKLRKHLENGASLVFVSHNLTSVMDICQESMLFFGGELKFMGVSNAAVNVYKGILSTTGKWPDSAPDFLRSAQRAYRFGVGGAKIDAFCLVDEKGLKTKNFFTGKKLKLILNISFEKTVQTPVYGLTIKDKDGHDIYMTDTLRLNKEVSPVSSGQKVSVEMEFKLPLIANTYFITPVISELGNDGHVCLDGIFDATEFLVMQENTSLGIVNFSPEVKFSTIK